MASSKETSHTFMVRIWREEREGEGVPPGWRGKIEHIRSGKWRYLNELDDIDTFIAEYLEVMGARLS